MKLHIGGLEKRDGWKILNILPGPDVDFLGDISDLSQFESGSVQEVYASHVLEHVAQDKVLGTLQGIHRVLVKGGKLYVSVPDMDVLCRVIISPDSTPETKYHAMRMLFGGQTDAHDFHYIGFNQYFLTGFLQQAGFAACSRVPSFGLFKDTSEFQPYGFPISLNMIATK